MYMHEVAQMIGRQLLKLHVGGKEDKGRVRMSSTCMT